VIQDGFDRGYQVGSLFAVLKVVEGSLLNTENSNETGSDEEAEVEESKIVSEIEEIRKTLQERIPEIKIASNLFK
jgi:hypothetical protein